MILTWLVMFIGFYFWFLVILVIIWFMNLGQLGYKEEMSVNHEFF